MVECLAMEFRVRGFGLTKEWFGFRDSGFGFGGLGAGCRISGFRIGISSFVFRFRVDAS